MSHLVIARKYRPGSFDAVTGQEHVTRTLGNSISRGKVAHAYLFCGPRGVGKTSISRIFAKALNCAEGPTTAPCLKCANCVEIAQGNNLAVREIDGASNNSVDNVRELIDSFRGLPPPGSRYKIYIIDEVHMLSTAAFNALLKSLEEPPPHTVFILATTEPHKIPDTVISRCQRHDFRALTGDEIVQRLADIARQEEREVARDALYLVARLSDGSMRDAQSLLERVLAFCEGTVTADEAGAALGVVGKRALFELSEKIFSREAPGALEVLDRVFTSGIDPTLFLKEFVTHWRELLVARVAGAPALQRIGAADETATELLRQVNGVALEDVQDLAQLAREGADAAVRSTYPKYAIEALVVRLATREPTLALAELVAALSSSAISGVISPGSVASAPSSAAGNRQAVRTENSDRTLHTGAAPRNGGTPPSTAARSSNGPGSAVTTPARSAERPAVAAAGALQAWQEFVNSVADSGARILCEHLRRLSVQRFEDGTLEARGPGFTVSSLQQPDTQRKLQELLQRVTGVKNWKILLRPSERGNAPERDSLIAHEEAQSAQRARAQKESIAAHPAIKSLQRAFPGSKIEDIRLKQEE